MTINPYKHATILNIRTYACDGRVRDNHQFWTRRLDYAVIAAIMILGIAGFVVAYQAGAYNDILVR